jgi:hypothetical protein
MNEHSSYDQLIAQKLAELPVPDMADAIWSRIDAQLKNDPPGGRGSKPFGGAELIIIGTIIVFITALFIWYNTGNKKQDENIFPPAPVQEPLKADSLRDDTLTRQQSIKQPNIPITNKVFSNDASQQNPDTLINYPPAIILPIKQDTTKNFIPPINDAALKPPPDTTKAKPKGVKGLSDTDYKLILKKDSGKGK